MINQPDGCVNKWTKRVNNDRLEQQQLLPFTTSIMMNWPSTYGLKYKENVFQLKSWHGEVEVGWRNNELLLLVNILGIDSSRPSYSLRADNLKYQRREHVLRNACKKCQRRKWDIHPSNNKLVNWLSTYGLKYKNVFQLKSPEWIHWRSE